MIWQEWTVPVVLFKIITQLIKQTSIRGEYMTKHIANILTGGRIFGSILLLFFPAFSLEFYIIYLLCGFSDMIDGTTARRTNSTSDFGSKIDSIADLVFTAVSLIKLLPAIQ